MSNQFRMNPPTRNLYPDAPKLSPFSLGTATFGREIDETAAFAFMDHARALGITLFDTAATYSAGASETIVGHWLASRKPAAGELMVATKIYPPFTPEAIDQAVFAGAARLHLEVLDVLYLHKWDLAVDTSATLIALDNLLKAGRVRALGVSNFTASQLAQVLSHQKALGLTPFRLIQNNNNLAVRKVDHDLRTLCAAHEVVTVTYSPLGAGFLTGKHEHGVQAGSRFEVIPGHQEIYFTPTAKSRLAKLRDLSERSGQPMTRLALAWAIHAPGVDSVLIGGRTTKHLDQAFDALALHDAQLLAELRAI